MSILVTGGEGLIGTHLAAHPEVCAMGQAALDVCDPTAVARTLQRRSPTSVIHCAAMTRLDACDREPERAAQVNIGGTTQVARACARQGIRLLHLSTDYVLGGPDTPGYRLPVDASPQPLSVYAQTKWAAERAALDHGGTVVRVQWVYGASGDGFVNRALEKMRNGISVPLVTDQVGSPTPAALVAHWLIRLTECASLPSVLHLATRGEATPADWVASLADARGQRVLWHPISRRDLPGSPRPARSCLDVSETETLLGVRFPSWRAALDDCIQGGGRARPFSGR